MGLTKQQRAYLKAQKQAFKLHNSIFGCDDYQVIEEDILGFKKDFGTFFKPYCCDSTLTKEALENLTNPSKNGRNK